MTSPRPALSVIFSLERDDFSSNRHPALSFCLSMTFSENRYPPIGSWPEGMLFPDHALSLPVADAARSARPRLDPRVHGLRIERVGVTARNFGSRDNTRLRRHQVMLRCDNTRLRRRHVILRHNARG